MYSSIYCECISLLDKLLREGKIDTFTLLKTRNKAGERLNATIKSNNCSGIVISRADGESGIFSRVWGIVHINPDEVLRCTQIHSSIYGDAIALGKLYRELKSKNA